MNILETLKQLRDDLKTWVTNNLNALNAKIDSKTIPIDNKLSTTSTNPVQNKIITEALNNVPRFSGDYNDLTNAPNIAEDDSGSLVIADEAGNTIFKADADGIHTTALSLNGEAAATEKYVDEAIAGIDFPETDLTNYYTKEETDSAINAAKEEISESIVSESSEWKITDGDGNIIFSVDAEGAHTTSLTLNGEAAATETYVDNAIAAIPDVDLDGYATEKYVDDAIAAIPETDLSDYYTKEETDNAIEAVKEELSETITSPNSEWAVTDEDGNVIFKVDADGAHTTDLTLNGESVNSIIDTRVAALVDSAPGTLDTLNELAAALGDDPNFATTVATQIGNKVDKEDGKGLSTNDFTDEYKTKLDGLENLTETDPTVPAWAKAENPPTYTAEDVGALPSDTPLFSGDYYDLENAPNITEDNEGNLVIADADGNIVFRSDANGFETTTLAAKNISLDGEDLKQSLDNKQPIGDYALKDDIMRPVVISSVGFQYALSDSGTEISSVTTWNAATSPLSGRQRACAYGNGYYVVCGTSGEFAYSNDAITWNKINAFTTDVITGICYGKGKFIAIDSGGAMWIAEGEPIAWTQIEVAFTQILEAITYANDRFVVVGAAGLIAFSDNGLTWNEVNTGLTTDLYGLCYGDGKYVAVGLNGVIITSFDGKTWVAKSDESITNSFRTVAYGKGKFVLGGQGGIIRYSDDSITWQTATSDSASTISYIRAIVYLEGKFYAVMYTSNGTGEIWVSANCENWTVQKTTNGRLWCIVNGDDILVASGDNGAIYTLDSGIVWQNSEPSLDNGKYLWERQYIDLSDGSTVVSDASCIRHATPSNFVTRAEMEAYINEVILGGEW